MEIIYYKKYEEKKSNKRYGNLKNDLNRIEKDISSRNLENINFYQNISNYRKIKRLADNKGGLRLALFMNFLNYLP